jgi:hypothetical protein
VALTRPVQALSGLMLELYMGEGRISLAGAARFETFALHSGHGQ